MQGNMVHDIRHSRVCGDEQSYCGHPHQDGILNFGGDEIVVQAGDQGIRFLLVSGMPIREPVAWHGPIVMNTQEQLQQAFTELHQGDFIK